MSYDLLLMKSYVIVDNFRINLVEIHEFRPKVS